MYVPDLTRLSDSTAMTETFPSVICYGVNSIVREATEHKKAGNAGPGATLTRIAIHDDYVLLLG
jgi:hypothetical protein